MEGCHLEQPLGALCTPILEKFRGLRKLSIDQKYSNREIDSRQGVVR